MNWFARKSEVEQLRGELTAILDRVRVLESKQHSFRIGELNPYMLAAYWIPDQRPEVTHAEAIQLLMDHLGLKFRKTDAVPSVVLLEKTGKK